MTKNEKELIEIIRESENPEEALKTAVSIIAAAVDFSNMTSNEEELLTIIRQSEDPEKVAGYMFNLFFDYLHTHATSQEKRSDQTEDTEGSEKAKTSDN